MASASVFATAVRARVGFVATAIAVVVSACASPTLPLPPPEAPVQSAGIDADHVTLTASCGGAQGDAVIVVLNQNAPPDKAIGGAIASDCGSWDSSVYAHSGDVLSITQDSGGETSPSAVYVVR
jgi:hypothetical protein